MMKTRILAVITTAIITISILVAIPTIIIPLQDLSYSENPLFIETHDEPEQLKSLY